MTRAGLAATLVLLLAVPGKTLAAGFAISELGSRESGRGAAAAALADDASALFYNPANVARLWGLNVEVGGSGIIAGWSWTPPDGSSLAPAKTEPGVAMPPHAVATYGLGTMPVLGDVAVGLGYSVPFGSTFSWPASWAGREDVQKIALTVHELTPTVALRPSRFIAVGASFRFLPSNVYLKRAVRLGTAEEGTVELGGWAAGIGAAAGVTILPTESLALAFAWRSPVTLDFAGKSNFVFPPPFDPSAVDKDVKASLPLPQIFRAGLAFDVVPKVLNVSADVEYQQWSTFKSLDIRFQNADGTETISSNPRDSTNGWVVHAGLELRATESFFVRAGYTWDQLTIPEAAVNAAPPDSDKHVVSVGASYTFDNYVVSAHFSDAFFAPRTALSNAFPGTYRGLYPGGTVAYLFGLSLAAKFDVGPSPAP
jgi:long-chain fatty acid transport protein